jgi:hypothetical protein
MPSLETVALPKSTAGRKAEPLDEGFVATLVKAINKQGAKPDTNGNRPFHTNTDDFDTKGKASANGRRYANAVAEKLDLDKLGVTKVSVRVVQNGKHWRWGIYLPLPSENEEATAE